MGTPYSGFDVPPECVELLDGGDGTDPDEIYRSITVDLCQECSEVARRMAKKYDTSPLPQCDADAARWDDGARYEALVDDGGGDNDQTERMVTDALATVKADQNGDTDHVVESKITEAYVVVLSMEQLGYVDAARV